MAPRLHQNAELAMGNGEGKNGMNLSRRSFLKAAGGLAVAAPVAAAAPQVGAILGGEWAGGALAGGAGMAANIPAAVAGNSSLELMGAAGWAMLHRYSDSEWNRTRWLAIYRQHRIRVRRGREERKPARLLWLLEERRVAARCGANALRPTVDRKSRIRNARVRRLMKAAGFPGLPWEVKCG